MFKLGSELIIEIRGMQNWVVRCEYVILSWLIVNLDVIFPFCDLLSVEIALFNHIWNDSFIYPRS